MALAPSGDTLNQTARFIQQFLHIECWAEGEIGLLLTRRLT
jgi:hypothetical protein